ncbi:hypothetical protein FHX09_001507 [Rhizobium sp. BK538]|nr:hypothetical protein [Rhizobium sp. BK538]
MELAPGTVLDEVALGELHGIPERLCSSLEIGEDVSTASLLVVGGSRIAVFNTVPQGLVEQDGDFAGRGSDRLGLADACRQTPIECPQRGLSAPDRNRGKSQ